MPFTEADAQQIITSRSNQATLKPGSLRVEPKSGASIVQFGVHYPESAKTKLKPFGTSALWDFSPSQGP